MTKLLLQLTVTLGVVAFVSYIVSELVDTDAAENVLVIATLGAIACACATALSYTWFGWP